MPPDPAYYTIKVIWNPGFAPRLASASRRTTGGVAHVRI
jgi:hypothetical protein